MHRNGDACRTTNNRTTCIRMGALCYRVYCAEMVAIELLYTHEKLLTNGNISLFLFYFYSYSIFLLLLLLFSVIIVNYSDYYYSIIYIIIIIILLYYSDNY